MTSPVIDYLPVLQGKSASDVITTLIWNCAVVHFSDHHSYLHWFANEYGCMCIRSVTSSCCLSICCSVTCFSGICCNVVKTSAKRRNSTPLCVFTYSYCNLSFAISRFFCQCCQFVTGSILQVRHIRSFTVIRSENTFASVSQVSYSHLIFELT